MGIVPLPDSSLVVDFKPSDTQASRSGIADALFNTTQQRVLGLLFGQPNRSFFATEIMSLAGAGRGAVQRELIRLKSSELVTVTKVGNQKHYQASSDSPIYEELCSIIKKTVGLHAPLQSAIEKVQDRLELAILYGSTVKGNDTAKSDVDVLVVAESISLEEMFKLFSPVEKYLDRKINCTIYSPREFDDRRRKESAFISSIIKRPHVILAGKLSEQRQPEKSCEDRGAQS